MKNIRLGKDITIKWKVQPLTDELTLILIDSRANKIKLDYIIEDNSIVAKYLGKDQKYFGTYSVICYLNFNKENQSIIDRKYAFKLVCDSDNEDSVIELEDDEFSVGVKGDSAYKAWLNIGNTGTETDFINSLKYVLTDEDKEQFKQPAEQAATELTDKVNKSLASLILNMEQGNKIYNNF